MKKLLLLLSLMISITGFSQIKTSNISGTIKDKKGEILPGSTIQLISISNRYGASANEKGIFQVNNVILDVTYTVKITSVGYIPFEKKEVYFTSEKNDLDFKLEEESTQLKEVVVKQVSKKETSTALINTLKASYIVADGLSIESIKKTPDRTVGDALKRISGVTIQNDKFILVRGLADRYNSALLNKTQLPSTEPDRRAFSFDIIPTSLIDNIIINKGASANLPGDFAGGLVQITTKEVSGDFFNVSLGGSWGSLSTGQDFKLVDPIQFPTTFPSTNTYRIAGLGDRRAYTKLIGSPQSEEFSSIPNLNGNLSFGVVKNKWNILFSSTARNTYSANTTERLDYQSSTELAYNYKDLNYSNVQSLNGLLNVVYLGENRYSWKTLTNYQNEKSFLSRTGENYDNVQYVDSKSSNSIQKLVLNTQFEGKLKTWDFNVGYNLMLRDQPDYRVTPYISSLYTSTPYSIAWRDTYRFWSVMDENSFNGGFNKSIGDVRLGVGYLKKLRGFKARIFRYESVDLLNEITNNTDRYTADFDLANGYVMYEKEINKLKINTGVRTEYNLFKVQTSDFGGQKISVDREYLDVLPSLNATYSTSEKTKVRLSLSKTLARPEFREVSNFAYYDFVRNAQLLGNPNLQKTDIFNSDVKFELYPKSGENISIGFFGKKFFNPIEQIVADGSVPSNLLLTYKNPKDALVYGVEIELRKKLTDWLDLYSNTSLINSEVSINGVKRQLQGQSNYVVNGGLNLHKNNNTLNLSYNRVGDRISAVGFQGYPDIFENSRDVIDIVILRKIKNGEIKLAVSDIFRQPFKYYQNPNRTLIKINNETTVSLTLNYNL
jgi:hypothetical protein